MSRDGITVPGNIRDSNARHFYITRMKKLNGRLLNNESDDSSQTTAALTYLLDQKKHIYMEAIRIQKDDSKRSRMKNYSLSRLALG